MNSQQEANYTLTSVEVDGEAQDVFEVYADAGRAQTLGFVYDEALARILPAAPDLLAALESAVDAMEAADAYIKRGDYDGLPDEISEARAAIARAKGGAL